MKKKHYIMVTLQTKGKALDRKIIPINIYAGALYAGLYDLQMFCKDWIMPCLSIQGKSLVLNEFAVKELCQKLDSDSTRIVQQPILYQSTNTGAIQLIKRSMLISGFIYKVKVNYDYDHRKLSFGADGNGRYLSLDLQTEEQPVAVLHSKAEALLLKLAVGHGGLVFKQPSHSELRDD